MTVASPQSLHPYPVLAPMTEVLERLVPEDLEQSREFALVAGPYVDKLDLEVATEAAQQHPWKVTLKKVGVIAALAFGYIVATCLAFIPLICVGVARYCALSKIEEVRASLASSRFFALQSGLDSILEGTHIQKKFHEFTMDELVLACQATTALPLSDVLSFIEQVKTIERLLRVDPTSISDLHVYTQKIRSEIEKAIVSEVYQKAKSSKLNPCVTLIEVLSSKIRTASGGYESLVQFVQSQMGESYLRDRFGAQDHYNWGQIGEAIKDGLNAGYSIKRNNVVGTAFWSLAFPSNAYHSALGHLEPLKYNSYEHGNADIPVWDYYLGREGERVAMRFYLGPGPTGDHLLDAHLNRLEKMKDAGCIFELRHNLQHANILGEESRLFELLRKEQEHPDTFRLFSTPFDGQAWKMKGAFQKFSNPSEFCLRYAKYAIADNIHDSHQRIEDIEGDAFRYYRQDWKNDNGFYIGPLVMTDQQFKAAFVHAGKAFQEIYETPQGRAYWDHTFLRKWELAKRYPVPASYAAKLGIIHGKNRMGRMLQIAIQGFIAVGAIIKSLQDAGSQSALEERLNRKLDEDLKMATFGQACKQDIDRAVVLNVITRLYFQLISGQPITERDVFSIIGTVVARAQLVDHRAILKVRLNPLIDILGFVGQNQDMLKNHLLAYLNHFSERN